jgi:hypothetical protein
MTGKESVPEGNAVNGAAVEGVDDVEVEEPAFHDNEKPRCV